jgi:hypothetical protein
VDTDAEKDQKQGQEEETYESSTNGFGNYGSTYEDEGDAQDLKEGGEESDESSTNGFGNYGSTYPVDTDAEKAEANQADVLKAAV